MRKTLILLLTLIFSVMFSSTSFAEWKRVFTAEHGDTLYVDFESIKKYDGYIYFWYLSDFLKPLITGGDLLSVRSYWQGDCKKFRYKILSYSWHKEPIGGGEISSTHNLSDEEWISPSSDPVFDQILKSVCAYAR